MFQSWKHRREHSAKVRRRVQVNRYQERSRDRRRELNLNLSLNLNLNLISMRSLDSSCCYAAAAAQMIMLRSFCVLQKMCVGFLCIGLLCALLLGQARGLPREDSSCNQDGFLHSSEAVSERNCNKHDLAPEALFLQQRDTILFRSRRILAGSSPPQCRYKCGRCTSACVSVAVPVHPKGSKLSPQEYYPIVWRCRCGNRLFIP